jgi:hypothetical protein
MRLSLRQYFTPAATLKGVEFMTNWLPIGLQLFE